MRRPTHALAIGGVASLLLCFASTLPLAGQAAIPLASLTVPPQQLAPGCRLAPSDRILLDGGRVRSGLWAGLPIPSNPWRGAERAIVSTIRERVMASPPLPDGPPPSRAELAQFRWRASDDIEEAYVAVYADIGAGGAIVYALQFKTDHVADAPRRASDILRLTRGQTVLVVTGDGPCAESVATRLRELTAP